MKFITEFQQTWANPAMRHALLVHWPVALGALLALFALGLAFTGGKNATLRIVTLLIALALTGVGFMTVQSGEHAEHATSARSPEAETQLEYHEELAEKVPYVAAISAVMVTLTFISKKPVRVIALGLTVIASGMTGLLVAETGHAGGQLVYAHGLGVPRLEIKPAAATAPAARSSDPKVAFFQERIKPILDDHCTKCHNAARVARGKSGKLDQTSRASLLTGGRSGPAIVPGKPEESLLIQRVKGELPDEDLMPPPPNAALTQQQIADLEQWIRDGAAWE
jgi:uncharacterized membrane protein